MRLNKPLIVVLSSVLLLLAGTIPALADHYVYGSRDPIYQDGGWPEHFTWNKWYIYSIYQNADTYRRIVWKANNTDTRTRMASALAYWVAQDNSLGIEWHEWLDVTPNPNGWVINLSVFGTACPDSGSPGCVKNWTMQGSSPAAANRYNTANLYIDPSFSWSSENSQRAAYAHEIGHLYNLHERYHHTDPATCNDDETTIMDTIEGDFLGYWAPCDLILGPTSTDQNRIFFEYESGDCGFDAVSQSGDNLRTKWYDYAFENWLFRMNYYKLNPNQTWLWKGSGDHITDVGTEYSTASRVIDNYKPVKTLWGIGTYKATCAPWYGTKDNGTAVFGATTESGQQPIN